MYYIILGKIRLNCKYNILVSAVINIFSRYDISLKFIFIIIYVYIDRKIDRWRYIAIHSVTEERHTYFIFKVTEKIFKEILKNCTLSNFMSPSSVIGSLIGLHTRKNTRVILLGIIS